MIKCTVYGVPQPQGSMRAFIPKGWGRAVITSNSPKLKPWRQQVAASALEARDTLLGPGAEVWDGPISVTIDFFFERPKSVKSERKTTRPDVDKLLRGVFDALTGILFKDDSQVVKCTATKQFGSPARAEVSVERIS